MSGYDPPEPPPGHFPSPERPPPRIKSVPEKVGSIVPYLLLFTMFTGITILAIAVSPPRPRVVTLEEQSILCEKSGGILLRDASRRLVCWKGPLVPESSR